MDWVSLLRWFFRRKKYNIYELLRQQEQTKRTSQIKYLDKYYKKGDLFGYTTDSKGNEREIRIEVDKIMVLVYLVARPGMGKSKLLEHLIFNDIFKHRSLSVIDSNVDLVRSIAMKAYIMRTDPDTPQKIRERLQNDLRYYSFTHKDMVIGLNPLYIEDKTDIFSTIDDLVQIFKRFWSEAVFSARQEELLKMCLIILAANGQTISDVEPLLCNLDYRRFLLKKLKQIKNVDFTQVFRFFEFYNSFSDAQKNNYIQSILYKVRHLLMNPFIKEAFCSENCINFNQLIENSIGLFNIGNNRLKSDTNLVTAILSIKFKWAAKKQGELFLQQRKRYHLYIDEFQSCIPLNEEEFACFCEVMRKYGLRLFLSHHFPSQIPEKILISIFNSMDIFITLGVKQKKEALLLANQIFSKPIIKKILPGEEEPIGYFPNAEELAEYIVTFLQGRNGVIKAENEPFTLFNVPKVDEPPYEAFIDKNGNNIWQEKEAELLKASGAISRHELQKQFAEHEKFINSFSNKGLNPSKSNTTVQKGATPLVKPKIWQ